MHTLKKLPTSSPKKLQSGLSLLESLVALVVLALGVMGLAGVQTRLLVETRTANSRAVAVQLIDDLTNRMALNRYAAVGKPQLATANSQFSNSSYAFARSDITSLTAPVQSDCITLICTAAQLAAVDLFAWRTAVNAALPGAQTSVTQLSPINSDPRQLAIAIAWPANERTTNTTYQAPFSVTATNSTVTCPSGLICHVVYVQP